MHRGFQGYDPDFWNLESDNIRIFVKHPGKRNLCTGSFFFFCVFCNEIKQRLIGFQILLFQLRHEFAYIVIVGKLVLVVTLPDNSPLAIGENGTNAILCSMQYGMTSSSQLRSTIE